MSEYIGLAHNPDPEAASPDTFTAGINHQPDVPRTSKKFLRPLGLQDEFLGEINRETMTGGEVVLWPTL